MLIVGEAVGIWDVTVPSPQFCYESKTDLKNKVYLKKKKDFGADPRPRKDNLFFKATQVILIHRKPLRFLRFKSHTLTVSVPSLCRISSTQVCFCIVVIILIQFWILIFFKEQSTFNVNLCFRRKISTYSISRQNSNSKKKVLLE